MWPTAHSLQSPPCLNFASHVVQSAPDHWLLQWHTHAVWAGSAVTDEACPPQLAATVHSVHVGTVIRPSAHFSQSSPPNLVGHVSHRAPVQLFLQSHEHEVGLPGGVPVTVSAWSLQWSATVHCSHTGQLRSRTRRSRIRRTASGRSGSSCPPTRSCTCTGTA